MPCNQIIAAIDIGTSKTVAIAGTKDEQGKIQILSIGEAETKGVIRGTVQNIMLASQSIKEAIQKCQKNLAKTITYVYVGIDGRNISSEVVTHSKVINDIINDDDILQLTDEINKISAGQGENIIHVIAQDYAVDNVSVGINPKGYNGRKLEGTFYIVKGKEKAVKNIYQAVELAGLRIIRLFLEPLASAEAVLSTDEKEIGVILADIGAGTTDIAVFQDNILRYTGVVPLGGKAITNDIKKGCGILERHAEQIKIQYGAALSQKDFKKKAVSIKGVNGKTKEIPFTTIAAIINARVEEILGGIAYAIDNVRSDTSLGAGLVLTGGTTKLKSLLQLTKFRLAIETRIGIPMINKQEFATESYASAVGLIIKGCQDTEDRIERQRNKQERAAAAGQQQQSSQPNNQDKNSKAKDDKNKDKGNSKQGGGFGGFLQKIASKIFSEPNDSKM